MIASQRVAGTGVAGGVMLPPGMYPMPMTLYVLPFAVNDVSVPPLVDDCTK